MHNACMQRCNSSLNKHKRGYIYSFKVRYLEYVINYTFIRISRNLHNLCNLHGKPQATCNFATLPSTLFSLFLLQIHVSTIGSAVHIYVSIVTTHYCLENNEDLNANLNSNIIYPFFQLLVERDHLT